MIEIHLDGKPVTKLEAARAVAEIGGKLVSVGDPGDPHGWDVIVFPRFQRDFVAVPTGHPDRIVQSPLLTCESFSHRTAAEMRRQAEKIMLAAEVAELAEMLAAEHDRPEPAPRCTWCHEPAADGEFCAPCAAAKAKIAAEPGA